MAIKKSQLYSTLWESCNNLRGGMDASQYKDYVLMILFLKFISDKDHAGASLLIRIPEGCHFEDIIALKDKPNIGEGINIILSRLGETNEDYASIFTHAVDFCDEQKLGKGRDLVKTLTGLISCFQRKELNFGSNNAADDDLIGDAYEYLMKNFASQSGKSKGQFYTPAEVSILMSKLIGIDKDRRPNVDAYDPTCGSCSLLLRARATARQGTNVSMNGQEYDVSTIRMAIMNMIIHGVAATNQHLHNADTLDKDWPADEVTDFDAVMMNPPYSQKWSADKGFLSDPRFSDYGVLAPKSKADYAFLLHGFYHLKSTGTMGIVLPHGVLFRGGTEGKIRQKLLEKGYIYAVIGLPAGIFYSTGIPTIIMVLKKDCPGRDVLFIDGSKEFVKGKPQNTLAADNIKRLFDAYQARADEDKFAHVASFDEIKENDYNLNIPRYVDTFEPEPEIDLAELNKEMAETDAEIAKNKAKLLAMMQKLTTDDEKKAKDLQDFLRLMK